MPVRSDTIYNCTVRNIKTSNEVRGRGKNEQKRQSIMKKKRKKLHLGNSKIDNKENRIQKTKLSYLYIFKWTKSEDTSVQ